MSNHGGVLAALLASSAGNLRRFACLDLTARGLGVAALAALDLACATEPEPGVGYGLVICDEASFDRAGASLDPRGSLLAFVARGQERALHPTHHVAARVRCPDGEWQLLRRRSDPNAPVVSIVVTVQDEVRRLAALLDSLLELPAEPSWELVVVDRGSFDATGELLRHIDGDVQAFVAPRSASVTRCIYLGMLRARGELVAILDPDLRPNPELVVGLHHGATQHPHADVFAGPVGNEDTHLVAVRRRLLHGAPSPSALAKRLRASPVTLVPAFTARRT